ncbi:MAG: TMEM165/GDT1 family protein [Actinomycetota bacterium]|nr:TMEM165/GDT1 family protein [Actinomycetota bacterium]
MSFSLGVLAATFLVILSVELPDKTLVATLVLSTKYRPWPVLIGVTAAFFVQCVVAVTAGQLLHLLPHRLLLGVVALLFAAGAFVLLREARRTKAVEDAASDDDVPERDVSTRRMVTTSFGVLFAAEWGDASQLATAALTARYDEPVTVFVGAFVALVGVAALAVVLGQVILRVVPLVWIHRIAGVLFAVIAVIIAQQAIRG